MQLAVATARQERRGGITRADVEYVAACSRRTRLREPPPHAGRCAGAGERLAVSGAEVGTILRAEAVARPGHGKLRVTGVVAQEEVSDGRGHRLRRSGTARDSAEAARTALSGMGVPVERYDIHVNFPGGALVDGPRRALPWPWPCVRPSRANPSPQMRP